MPLPMPSPSPGPVDRSNALDPTSLAPRSALHLLSPPPSSFDPHRNHLHSASFSSLASSMNATQSSSEASVSASASTSTSTSRLLSKTGGRMRSWWRRGSIGTRPSSTMQPQPQPQQQQQQQSSRFSTASDTVMVRSSSTVPNSPPLLPALNLDQSFLDAGHATVASSPADEPPSQQRSHVHGNHFDSGATATQVGETFANRIWESDPSFLPGPKVAMWLGSDTPDANATRPAYFAKLNLHNLRLDAAFRRLCDHLYLQAETQQVDRLLAAFAQRYWECLPSMYHPLFHSPDAVHSLVYSLMLLNTDLYLADLTHHMTRGQYVHNTMHALAADGLGSASTWLAQRGGDNGDTFDTAPRSSIDGPPPAPSTGAAHLVHAGGGRTARTLNRISMSISGALNFPGLPSLSLVDEEGNVKVDECDRDKAWGKDMEALLRDMYTAVKAYQIRLPARQSATSADLIHSDAGAGHANRRASILSPRSWGSGRPASSLGSGLGSNTTLAAAHTSPSTISSSTTQLPGPRQATSRRSSTRPRSLTSPRTSSRSIVSTPAHSDQQHGQSSATNGPADSLSLGLDNCLIGLSLEEQSSPTPSTPNTSQGSSDLRRQLGSSFLDSELVDADKTVTVTAANDTLTGHDLVMAGTPWCKSGLLLRCQVMGERGKKVRDRNARQWQEKFAVLDDGTLRLYRLGPTLAGSKRETTTSSQSGSLSNTTVPVGGGNWRANATMVSEIPLAHARASVLGCASPLDSGSTDLPCSSGTLGSPSGEPRTTTDSRPSVRVPTNSSSYSLSPTLSVSHHPSLSSLTSKQARPSTSPSHRRSSLVRVSSQRGPWVGPWTEDERNALLLPSFSSSSSKATWVLWLPSGAIWAFAAGTRALATEWVDTVMYWTARSTRPPMLPGVGPLEYGWGAALGSVRPVTQQGELELYESNSKDAHDGEKPTRAPALDGQDGDTPTVEDDPEEEQERIETPSTTPTSSSAALADPITPDSHSLSCGAYQNLRTNPQPTKLRRHNWTESDSMCSSTSFHSARSSASSRSLVDLFKGSGAKLGDSFRVALGAPNSKGRPGTTPASKAVRRSFLPSTNPESLELRQVALWTATPIQSGGLMGGSCLSNPRVSVSLSDERDQRQRLQQRTTEILQDLDAHTALQSTMWSRWPVADDEEPTRDLPTPLAASGNVPPFVPVAHWTVALSGLQHAEALEASASAPQRSTRTNRHSVLPRANSLTHLSSASDPNVPRLGVSVKKLDAIRARANWHRKRVHLLAELDKYATYLTSLRAAEGVRAALAVEKCVLAGTNG